MNEQSIRHPSRNRPAPPSGGVGLLLSALLLLPACGSHEREGGSPADLRARELGLEGGAVVHTVVLGGRGAEEHAAPSHVRVRPGDAVEFRTVDHRVHTVVFPPDSLSPPLRAFLESTGQGASPPLVSRNSRYVLRLEGAPPGRYPFVSRGHGGTDRGSVQVLGVTDSTGAGGG